MKVLVTGAMGQLGYDVCRVLDERGIGYFGTDINNCDITDPDAVSELFRREAPDAVIHCAAYTNVNGAEDNPELCFRVNETGTANIASECGKTGAKLIYISTDYVFPGTGDGFYGVNDAPGPRNVYGKSKLAGEIAVRSLTDRYFIVRISWVFGKNGNNFIKTMLRLAQTHDEVGVVCDQVGSPTYTADLALLLCDMAATEKFGVYHATNEGVCSWAELAETSFRLAGTDTRVRRLTTAEYPAKAVRPMNSRMSKDSLDAAGFARLPDWQDAVGRYLKELAQ